MATEFDLSKIDWKWVGISVLIFIVAQVALSVVFSVIGVLTLGIGFILFMVFKPLVYFLGGYITGRISPGLTIFEPAVGALIVSIGGAILDRGAGSILGVVISAIIAFFAAVFGASLGERT